MKIYIAHSSGFNYEEELYAPIRKSELSKEHKIIFPHEKSAAQFNSKEFLKKEANLVIAEISYPSTGMGIELGWADYLNLPVICVYKKNSNYSKATIVIAKEMIEYLNSSELIKKLTNSIKKYQLKRD